MIKMTVIYPENEKKSSAGIFFMFGVRVTFNLDSRVDVIGLRFLSGERL